ncbi:MAG: bifunctional phosphoribosyl-AMP cyclohydrolase/phosphoribosyl-ATP diphosphatase HisIE [Thermoguttaceae bacterium]
MTEDLSKLDWCKSSDGLLPAIVQDANTARVLMLGYMNEESLRQTQRNGRVTFFSRSKGRLWEKGESSGHTLEFVSAASDCDGDTILVRAIPHGPTCHTNEPTCFGAEELGPETLGELTETIRRRGSSEAEASYTKRLLEGGVEAYGAKVLEEAEEVVRAAREEGRQRTVEEVADVLYHLFVLLRGQGIELADVAEELRRRRRPAGGATSRRS